MPRLERPSVVVMDNAPYHNTKINESFYPKQNNRKEDIPQWLRGKNVEITETMKKVLKHVHFNLTFTVIPLNLNRNNNNKIVISSLKNTKKVSDPVVL